MIEKSRIKSNGGLLLGTTVSVDSQSPRFPVCKTWDVQSSRPGLESRLHHSLVRWVTLGTSLSDFRSQFYLL